MNGEIYNNLKKAILEYDAELGVKLACEVVEQGQDILKAIDVMAEALKVVGDRFGKGELFLPELMGAGDVMSKAMSIFTTQLEAKGQQVPSLGRVVIGTVRGDIHNIGKTLVATLLTTGGFSVCDLGVDVEPRKFVNMAMEVGAEILAMSALLTTTAPEQKRVIELLKEEGLRNKIKVMVGGGAISQEFADSIGADAYGATAYDGLILAKRFVERSGLGG